MENKKEYVIAQYRRCSTDEQTLKHGLDVQKEKNDAFIMLRDFDTKDELTYVDEGFSGTLSPEDRPALKRLLRDAKNKRFDAVVVARIDRLARENYLVIGIVKKLSEYGIDFFSATEAFDTATPSGNFMLQLFGGVAEMDRRNILERTQSGRIQAAKKGQFVFGTPPYGFSYNKESKKIDINEEQAQWIKKFFEWLVYEKCSLKEIARRANSLKIKTKLQADNSSRKATGLWYPRTLGRILTNEIYTGKKYINKYKSGHKDIKTYENKDYMKDESEWILINVPQVISRELFDESISQLRKNSEFALRKKKRDYMFSGLLHCSKCKYKLRGVFATPKSETAKGSRHYFGFKTKNDSPNTKRCDYCGSVAESRVMPVWYALERVLANPNIAYKQLKKYTNKDKTNDYQEKLKLIKSEATSLYKKRKRLTKAYLEFGSIEDKEYNVQLKKIEKRMSELSVDKARFKDLEISEREKVRRVDLIGNLYKQFSDKLIDASYETKMQILRLFVDRIDLNLATNTAQVALNFSSSNTLKDNSHYCACFGNGTPCYSCSCHGANLHDYPRSVSCGIFYGVT